MTKFLYKNGYWIWWCNACDLGRTDLKKEYESFVKDFYSEGYFSGDPTRSAYANYEFDKPQIVANMRKFLSFLPHNKIGGKLLDIGCAYGYFVELAQKHLFDAYGLDPSTHAVGKARKLVGKNKITEGTIGSATYSKDSFDIITMFDVFEHLEDPLGDMKKIAKWLKPDGLLLFATGDTQSLAAKVMKRRWTFYIPPQHIYFFNRNNVKKLLQKSGLEPVAWHRVGKWLSLGYVLHLARTTGESKLAVWLYELIKNTPLMRLPLYVPMKDNMVVLARKQ